MRLFFTADLHLHSERPNKIARFIEFLDAQPQSGDWLILGGDIFDLYIGKSQYWKKIYFPVQEALLRTLERGVRLRYLEGNHDFLLQNIFPENVGDWQIWPRGGWIDFAGKRVFVEHGDEIDRSDYGYRFLRFFTRSFLGRNIIRILPDFLLAKIGKWSSQQSRKYNNAARLTHFQQERTCALFAQYARQKYLAGADFIFIGHSHLPQQAAYPIEAPRGVAGYYVNIGYHEEKIPYAELHANRDTCQITFWG